MMPKETFPDITPVTLANDLNNHFIRSISQLTNRANANCFGEYASPSNIKSAYFPTVTESELWDVIKSIPLTRSAGFDGIRIRDLFCNFEKLKIYCSI